MKLREISLGILHTKRHIDQTTLLCVLQIQTTQVSSILLSLSIGIENMTNDITLPALNISHKDDLNETLEKVKLRSRSVLKNAGLHLLIKPRIKMSE